MSCIMSKQRMAMNASEVEVRDMRQNEAERVRFLYKRNQVVSIRMSDIQVLHRDHPGHVLVALRGEDCVVGACFALEIDQNVGLISGFVVCVTEDNYMIIQLALLEAAKRRLPNRRIELIVPRNMRKELRPEVYQKHWDIHLYFADICDIILPLFHSGEYMITKTEGSFDIPNTLNCITPEGIILQPSFEQGHFPPIACFQVHMERNIVGYGMINKNDEREWIIGPFLASDEIVANVLLREILTYIKQKDKCGFMYVYVIANSIMPHLLENSGFESLLSEWSRYSCVESRRYQLHFWPDYMRNVMNALSSIIFSVC